MTINRKIIATIAMVFAIGLITECDKQEQKTEQSLQPAVQKTEAGESVQPEGVLKEEIDTEREKKDHEVQPVQEEAVPVATAGETAPEEKISDVKNEVSAQYIGAKKCKTCHMKQYKAWKKTKMATSFENLKPGVKAEAKKLVDLDPDKDYTTDPECLKCHTTGYGKPSGFVSLEETPDLINVQCEACHGPGSEFEEIMKKNKKFKLDEVKAVGYVFPGDAEAEKQCRVCHNDESFFNEKVNPKYRFDFKERIKNSHEHFPLKYEH